MEAGRRSLGDQSWGRGGAQGSEYGNCGMGVELALRRVSETVGKPEVRK